MVRGALVADQSTWQIPRYAQSLLWVRCGGQAAPTSGARGTFTLAADDVDLTLTWGGAEGPVLARWSSADATTLDWRGGVGIAGFIERLHIVETRGLELLIAEIEGDALPPGYRRLPSLAELQAGHAARPDESSGFRQFTYTVVALADSVYADYLHHAMVSELAVDCFASLGPHEGRWHELVGLPLLIEGLSLLAPG